jgi:Pyridoxamine 5'-phosphate oxidase
MTEPTADRPHVPGYGIPESTEGILRWAWAVERLDRALVYWLATASSDAAPHVIPIWGAWVDGRWYVEGGPTRWQRNLRANPQMAIHVEFGDEVVIVEGTARELVDPAAPLASQIVAGYAKYIEAKDYRADPANWSQGGLWELRPIKAFAWSVFPDDMTRFRFPTGD